MSFAVISLDFDLQVAITGTESEPARWLFSRWHVSGIISLCLSCLMDIVVKPCQATRSGSIR
jgi:hypothetical protein